MTVSVLALITDVMREGRPVVGFGFNSNGRYAPSGLLRDRFIPRLKAADPEALVDEGGENLDPMRIWDAVMRNEKPGGHGERSVAVGVLDMAVWDAVAKIAGLPLFRLLANRFRGGVFDDKVFVYAAGGYYYPEKDLSALQNEMRGYLDLGYSVVKMKIGGAPLPVDLRRIEAVLKILKNSNQLAVDANGRFDLEKAIAYAKALAPYLLRWYEEPGDPLDFELRLGRIPSNSRNAEGLWMVASPLHSARWTSNVVEHRRRFGLGGQRILSRNFSAVRWIR